MSTDAKLPCFAEHRVIYRAILKLVNAAPQITVARIAYCLLYRGLARHDVSYQFTAKYKQRARRIVKRLNELEELGWVRSEEDGDPWAFQEQQKPESRGPRGHIFGEADWLTWSPSFEAWVKELEARHDCG